VGLDVTGRFRYPSPDQAWLARNVEDVLDPALPIIDCHHHLWVEGEAPYLLPEITADVEAGHNISATVFVQAHYGYRDDLSPQLAPVGETEKVVAIAEAARHAGCSTDIAQGIVAFADLTLGDAVSEVLEAHVQAGCGRFRGVRHSVSRDEHFPNGIVIRPAPANLLSDDTYRKGLAAVAARGLSYDAMIYHSQVHELTAMASDFSDLSIVLDHVGCILGVGWYEGRTNETFESWRSDMADLAQRPNVRVKVGGFGMIICGARWHERDTPPGSAELAEAWRPYVETCIELFGVERCMFESNFPVDKAMYSYRALWNAFKRLTVGASSGERHALFAGTAADFYRITDPVVALSETVRG
jgi:predicted TIM-barrel fold metal-dependent hydrolase